MTMPPLKLNPFNAGKSKDNGDPSIKNNTRGTINNKPKAVKATGNCLPVSSCLFLDHFLKIKLDIKAKIKAIKTNENPF